MTFYIRNYDDKIVGNPNGYKSIRSANHALARKYKQYRTLKDYLWLSYYLATDKGFTGTTVYHISE